MQFVVALDCHVNTGDFDYSENKVLKTKHQQIWIKVQY